MSPHNVELQKTVHPLFSSLTPLHLYIFILLPNRNKQILKLAGLEIILLDVAAFWIRKFFWILQIALNLFKPEIQGEMYELLLMKNRKRFTKVPRRILNFIPSPILL